MDDSTRNDNGTLAVLKSDFPASIVVFLVALPLCMGIAIASGVPVAARHRLGIVARPLPPGTKDVPACRAERSGQQN